MEENVYALLGNSPVPTQLRSNLCGTAPIKWFKKQTNPNLLSLITVNIYYKWLKLCNCCMNAQHPTGGRAVILNIRASPLRILLTYWMEILTPGHQRALGPLTPGHQRALGPLATLQSPVVPWGPLWSPAVPCGPLGSWGPLRSWVLGPGYPRGPLGSPGVPWGPLGSPGVP